jgi:hypothetical protein
MSVAAHPSSNPSPADFWWRALCFLLCIPSGGALLAKVYGWLELNRGVWLVALPCCAALVGLWLWTKRTGRSAVAEALTIGFVGGLFGRLAYDVVRIPPLLSGQRIFAPISAYGAWIADASSSSRFTERLCRFGLSRHRGAAAVSRRSLCLAQLFLFAAESAAARFTAARGRHDGRIPGGL